MDLPLSLQVEYDRVLLQIPEQEELPDQRIGVVAQVGSGRILANGDREPLSVSEGDRVLVRPVLGVHLLLAGQPFVIVREAEILLLDERKEMPARSALSPSRR